MTNDGVSAWNWSFVIGHWCLLWRSQNREVYVGDVPHEVVDFVFDGGFQVVDGLLLLADHVVVQAKIEVAVKLAGCDWLLCRVVAIDRAKHVLGFGLAREEG